jgi:hypothetical protein
VRLVAGPGDLRDVELEVLGWRTWAGELMLRCRLVDGSVGEVPAAWSDLPPLGLGSLQCCGEATIRTLAQGSRAIRQDTTIPSPFDGAASAHAHASLRGRERRGAGRCLDSVLWVICDHF